MREFRGIGVHKKIAIGRLCIYAREEIGIERQSTQDPERELARFGAAKETVRQRLQQLCGKAEGAEKSKSIFGAYQVLLEDPEFNSSVEGMIRAEGVNAEYGVFATGKRFCEIFEGMKDLYIRERAADIRDLTRQLLDALAGREGGAFQMEGPGIVLAEDLTPSETLQFEKEKILGFIVRKGGIYSHTAILAKSMDIPATVQTDMEIDPEYEGETVILDGVEGKIFLNPDPETVQAYRKKMEDFAREEEALRDMIGKESVTLDGKRVRVCANMGSLRDMRQILEHDADGVGLFRTEFLYLERDEAPTEEEQFAIYQTAAEQAKGKEVILRTLDMGADKQVGYFQMPEEENPALGYRAIRICLEEKELFYTQLRAIYRASCYGNLGVMFPMIASLEEVLEIKEDIRAVKGQLRKAGQPYRDIPVGIMIETPAAALISDRLAKEVDFFSIGTNDLAQYTLAVDRTNPRLGRFFNPKHEAVMRLIGMVAEAAKAAGIRVGICGELAGDLSLTQEFIAMGIDELSVAAPSILGVRRAVRESVANRQKTATWCN